jgi:SAM-dependent methyltransferase
MSAGAIPRKKKVFVSYSRSDEEWLDRLRDNLATHERQENTEFWIDKDKLRAGEIWTEELQRAIDSADAAILLVSASYFRSDFIWNKELPELIRLRERGGTLLVLKRDPDELPHILSQFQLVDSRHLEGMARQEYKLVFQRLMDLVREVPLLPTSPFTVWQSAVDPGSTPPPNPDTLLSADRNQSGGVLTRHQVFLGSTFWTLRPEERLVVFEALYRLPVVSTGGELFAAKDWQSIQDEIEESDYFLAITPHPCDGVLSNGVNIQQVEKEYDHAVAKDKPVLRLLQSSLDEAIEDELSAYRGKLERDGGILIWHDESDLVHQLTNALDALISESSDHRWLRVRPEEGSSGGEGMPALFRLSILKEMSVSLSTQTKSLGLGTLDSEKIRRNWLGPARTSLEFTIRDLEKVCGTNWSRSPLLRECISTEDRLSIIRPLLNAARGDAFDKKYGHRLPVEDERYFAGGSSFRPWVTEVIDLLRKLQVPNFDMVTMVNVGVGNGIEGIEGRDLYADFGTFLGVDIAKEALAAAKNQFSDMEKCEDDSAERLSSIDTGSLDLYLSFRTYQSTLLDIDRSLYEAYRVLRPGARLLISIPNKYIKGKGPKKKLVEGLLRPESDFLDTGLPFAYLERIRGKLQELKFWQIGYHTGEVELYVSARRSLIAGL